MIPENRNVLFAWALYCSLGISGSICFGFRKTKLAPVGDNGWQFLRYDKIRPNIVYCGL